MDINFDDHRFRTLEIFPRNVSSLAKWDTTRIGQLSGPVHVEVKRGSFVGKSRYRVCSIWGRTTARDHRTRA